MNGSIKNTSKIFILLLVLLKSGFLCAAVQVKVDGPKQVRIGDEIEYTISIKKKANQDTDTDIFLMYYYLPDELEYVSAAVLAEETFALHYLDAYNCLYGERCKIKAGDIIRIIVKVKTSKLCALDGHKKDLLMLFNFFHDEAGLEKEFSKKKKLHIMD